MLVTCLWYLNCLEKWLGSVEYFLETRLGLDKDNYSMKMFDFKMFWIANELIQREYDSFFFLIPHFWFDNYRSLVQKCQRSSTRVAFLFLREEKGGLTKFKAKYKC